VQIHQGSERRASWAANAIDGWYLQTSPEHYRCHVIYVKQTKNERVSDTVFFKTKYITQPTLTRADIITKALNDLTQAIKGIWKRERIRTIRHTQKVRRNPQQQTWTNPNNDDRRTGTGENNIRRNHQGTSRNRAKRSSTNTKGDQAAPKDTKPAKPWLTK
jgi:hypothetical protein